MQKCLSHLITLKRATRIYANQPIMSTYGQTNNMCPDNSAHVTSRSYFKIIVPYSSFPFPPPQLGRLAMWCLPRTHLSMVETFCIRRISLLTRQPLVTVQHKAPNVLFMSCVATSEIVLGVIGLRFLLVK